MPSWTSLLPPAATTLWLLPVLLAGVFGVGAACGLLKLRRGLRTGDTRKLFHFTVFSTAVVLSALLGAPGVHLLGLAAATFVAVALVLGDGHPLFEGLARESDLPHRALYVFVPFIATVVGGLVSVLLFGPLAIVGYAVAGWGDAVGEPVGIRFGRHRYRVPNLGAGVASTRSLEGSAAVLVASALAAFVVLSLPQLDLGWDAGPRALAALAIAVPAAGVEAISHHGLDNLTLQVAASAAAWGCVSCAC